MEAVCGKAARTALCGGRIAICVPTAILIFPGDFAGLQGADQYAWEQFHFLKGKNQGTDRDVREPFYFLLESIPKLHTRPSREFLIKLCEAKGIDPRTGVRK